MVSATEMFKFEPNIQFAATAYAAYSANDGAIDPVLATHALLKAAQQLGVSVQYPVELKSVSTEGGRLTSVETSAGSIKADRLVLATGAASQLPMDIAGVDIPQRSTPGIIAITEPLPRLVTRVISAPGIHSHQRGHQSSGR